MMRAVVVFALFAAVTASKDIDIPDDTSDDNDDIEPVSVNKCLDLITHHAHKNPMFAELQAGFLNAMDSQDETSKSGRSPMAEIAALTDMMVIQTNHEIAELQKNDKLLQAQCTKDLLDWSNIIARSNIKMLSTDTTAYHYQRQWIALLPKIPALYAQIAQKNDEVRAGEDDIFSAQSVRDKRHQAYLQAVDEHDVALNDLRNIRLILQESALDDKSNVGATVSSGTKSVAKPTVTNLLEISQRAHPKLQSLLEVAIAATTKSSGMDTIYKLIYQTRDQILQSKAKIITSERTAIGNWRTNKLALRTDINDARILAYMYYQQIGTVKKTIGTHKQMEGWNRVEYTKAMTTRDTYQIYKDFEEVSCEEARDKFDVEFAGKRNEREALVLVQKKLTELKWSDKVYAAIATVTEGIVYLHGEYNIRSGLGRYMIRSGSDPKFDATATQTNAQQFKFELNKDDLSYKIISMEGVRQYFLTETGKSTVIFGNQFTGSSRWNMIYDTASGKIFIRNKASKNTLFVDAAKGYKLSTISQTEDKRSEFLIERPEYAYEGCYRNKIGDTLATYIGSTNTMNTGECYRACVSGQTKFTHFGLSEGKQCSCGTTFAKLPAPRTDCGYICNGREGDLCGGRGRTIMYKVAAVDPKTSKPTKPIMAIGKVSIGKVSIGKVVAPTPVATKVTKEVTKATTR